MSGQRTFGSRVTCPSSKLYLPNASAERERYISVVSGAAVHTERTGCRDRKAVSTGLGRLKTAVCLCVLQVTGRTSQYNYVFCRLLAETSSKLRVLQVTDRNSQYNYVFCRLLTETRSITTCSAGYWPKLAV
jgi:hypothetical protein